MGMYINLSAIVLSRVGPDIRCGRIPDIETIRPDIRQYNLLYFTTKISVFLIFNGFNFLIIEARRTIFSEYVYVYVNFILEISKHKFWRWQQYLAAASRKPTVGR